MGLQSALGSLVSAYGILKIGKPRVKQAWQAYHTMTYESVWKEEINRQWEEYKLKAEDLNELKKTRFDL